MTYFTTNDGAIVLFNVCLCLFSLILALRVREVHSWLFYIPSLVWLMSVTYNILVRCILRLYFRCILRHIDLILMRHVRINTVITCTMNSVNKNIEIYSIFVFCFNFSLISRRMWLQKHNYFMLFHIIRKFTSFAQAFIKYLLYFTFNHI